MYWNNLILTSNILLLYWHMFCKKHVVFLYLWSFMILGVSVLELSSGNHLVGTETPRHQFIIWSANFLLNYIQERVTVALTLDLVTSKSIGVIRQSWSMYQWSFMILGVSVIELSSGNHQVNGPTDRSTDRPTYRPTDGQTDGPTDRHVQNNIPPLLRWGIIRQRFHFILIKISCLQANKIQHNKSCDRDNWHAEISISCFDI